MLSENVQCNSEIGLPVNKTAQKKLIDEIDLEGYGIEKIANIMNLLIIILMF